MPDKFKLSANGKVQVYSKKTYKIITTEEDAKAIVAPLVDFTAYCLSIEKVGEMPALKTLGAAMLRSKTRLATLLALARGGPVEPKNLTGINVQVITFGGYFKIDVTEVVSLPGGKSARRAYTVVLMDRTGMTLANKLLAIFHKQNPEANDQEIVKMIGEYFTEL